MGIVKLLKRRGRDDDGGIMIFIIMMFLTMIVFGGMATDFMRHEAARADLQNALDRGVLALTASTQNAVDKTNQDELEAFVGSYMLSSSFIPPEGYDLSVPPDTDSDFSVNLFEATASYEMPTYFLKLIGFPSILVRADSTAREGIRDLEIAVVLDLSISMDSAASGTGHSKLEELQIAAGDFVDTMLATEAAKERTLISIVPYSSSVAISSEMANLYTVRGPVHPELAVTGPTGEIAYIPHNYTNFCFDFDIGDVSASPPYIVENGEQIYSFQGDYNVADINPGVEQLQLQSFRVSDRQDNCHANNNRVKAFSNDPISLETMINGLSIGHSTATYLGVKWGMALLQPSASPVLVGLANVAGSGVDGGFADGTWPRDRSLYGNNNEVGKIMVLMTDGENRSIYRHSDERYAEKSLWEWDTERASVGGSEIINDYNASQDSNNDGFLDGDTLQRAACDAAKRSGIEIYAIGFEMDGVQQRALDTLLYCASGENHYFRVDGIDISSAFNAIAASASNLKLVN